MVIASAILPEKRKASRIMIALGRWSQGSFAVLLTQALIAALVLVFCETIQLYSWLPYLGSNPFGLLAYFTQAWLMITLLAWPIAWAADRLFSRVASWMDGARARVLSLIPGTVCLTLLLLLVEKVLPDGQHNQFPQHIAFIRHSGFALAVFVGILGIEWVFLPLARYVLRYLPHLSSTPVLQLVIAGILFVLSFRLITIGMMPVHLDVFVPPVALFSLLMLLWAARSLLNQRITPAIARSSIVLFLLLCVVSTFGTIGGAHGRFLLYAHAPLSAPVARLLRDVLDIDGDGASPSWLGGTDCAEGNPRRGPGQPETRGDGIDQDCRGGDATHKPYQAQRASWPNCRLPQKQLSVVVIIIDAWRSDSVKPHVMPNVVRFLSQSVVFTRAYSPATFTDKSMVGILVGKTVSDTTTDNPLIPGFHPIEQTLTQHLRKAGFYTGMFHYIKMDKAITQGFAESNNLPTDAYALGVLEEFSSAKVTTGGIDFVARNADRPFFLWLHYPDAHAPYQDPKLSGQGAEKLSPYERNLAYVDIHIGRFLRFLVERDLFANTAVFITADHGEDLGRRGHEGHGPDAYEDTIRVPLFAWIPGCSHFFIDEPVSLTQLGASLSPLTGVSIPGEVFFSRVPEKRLPAVVEALYDEGRFPSRTFKRAIISSRYKLIVDVRNGGRLLFDIKRDPGETKDIYLAEPKAARHIEAEYQRWLDR